MYWILEILFSLSQVSVSYYLSDIPCIGQTLIYIQCIIICTMYMSVYVCVCVHDITHAHTCRHIHHFRRKLMESILSHIQPAPPSPLLPIALDPCLVFINTCVYVGHLVFLKWQTSVCTTCRVFSCCFSDLVFRVLLLFSVSTNSDFDSQIL